MFEYEFTRELVDGKYNVPNSRSSVRLLAELSAAVPGPKFKVQASGFEVTVCTDLELTPAQLASVGSAIADHKARNDVDPSVPEVISARQIRLQLVSMGIDLSTITLAIDSLPEPDRTVASLEWEYATGFERHNPLILAVGAALSLTEEQLDQIWTEGVLL